MEWQISNALFIAVTTLAVFLTVGIAAKITIKQIKWSWLAGWMAIGVSVVLIQIQGAASPKMTVDASIPVVSDKEVVIEKTDLVPIKPMQDWIDSTDVFDEKQDQRIKDNM